MSSGFFTSLARKSFRPLIAALVIALVGSLTFATADARIGGGSSFGSRGSRTYSMPSGTATAPSVSPFQHSTTPRPGGFNNGGFASPGFSRPGFFGGGFGRGLLGGFLGAGLFGLLFGHGLTGGLGGGFSIIGLILQLGLLYLAFRFIMGFIRNRQSYGSGSSMSGGSTSYGGANPYGGAASGGGYGGAAYGAAPQTTPITLDSADYQAFERRLIDCQNAYSNGDTGTLRRLATPEMAGNFEQELADNNRQGVVNKISDVRLLQGDLSEAWRENGSDYASVAMRFSLVDATIDQRSGRVVAGDPSRPQEATEVWTFVRPSGATANAWALSGIQQT